MRTKIEIFQDVNAAALTSASSDHFRALSGAQWLQQLANELVEVIKTEQFKRLAEAFDAKDSPGEGWRWLKPGEVIQYGDEVRGGTQFFPVGSSTGCKVLKSQPTSYRRRI